MVVGIANYFHFVFSLTVYMNVGLCYRSKQREEKEEKKPDENTLFAIYMKHIFS